MTGLMPDWRRDFHKKSKLQRFKVLGSQLKRNESGPQLEISFLNSAEYSAHEDLVVRSVNFEP